MRCFCLFVTEFFCQPNEQSFDSSNVAEPISVFVLDYLTNELRTMFTESGYYLVNVFHSEHNP